MQGYVLILFCLFMASLSMDIHGGRVQALTEFDVGGWQVPNADDPEAYNHWAEKMRFHTGDAIRFRYQNDSVLMVDKYGYYHCKSDEPIASFSDGNTVITAQQPGFIYFISGDYDHCKSGQRMIVDVMSVHTRSHPHRAISPVPGPWAASTSPGPAPVSPQVAAALIMMSVYYASFVFA